MDAAERLEIADAAGIGRMFIANPDLAHRWQHDLPTNEPKGQFFYTGGETGYTDYPFHGEA